MDFSGHYLHGLVLLMLAACGWAGSKPNLVFMFADDLGYDDLGYVNSEVISPNIDALAAEGVKLSNNYVMNVCTPTRHATMTGRYPFKTWLSHIVIFPMQQLCTPINIKMLPQYLKDNGYNTYAAGKWHMGFCREECIPTNRGFDNYFGYYQGEQDYYNHTSGPPGIVRYDFRNQAEIDWSVDGKFNTYIMRDWIVDKIKSYDSTDPFFLYIAWPNPHTPLDTPSYYYGLYANTNMIECRKKYLGLVTALDDAVGNVTQALKDAGHWDNTILIFSSDNGGSHGYCASNGKLRGSKGSMFEGGIKALAFVHSKLLTKSGYTNDGLFHVTDWLPTIMGMIGADDFDKEALDIDGYDQSDMIMNGGESARNEIVFNIDMAKMPMMGQSAVRIGDYKLLWGGYGATDGYYEEGNLIPFYANDTLRAAAGFGPYQGDPDSDSFDFSTENKAVMTTMLAKLFRFLREHIDSGRVYLFNIKDDPYERTDLAENDSFATKLRLMKLFVLEMIKNQYRPPSDEAQKNNQWAADNPAYNGTWSTGWCDNVNLTLPAN